MVWGIAQRCVPNIKVMDGLFLAGRREVFSTVPYDEETFKNFHLYDVDITCRAALAGFRLAVCTDFVVTHASDGNFDERWRADCELFIRKFGPKFYPVRRKWWLPAQFKTQSREDLLEMMRNPDWPD
jgi:GT2 family glycosyltransferase